MLGDANEPHPRIEEDDRESQPNPVELLWVLWRIRLGLPKIGRAHV